MPIHRVESVDIGRSAHGMLRFYGDAAEAVAMACAKKFEKSKDRQGIETWTAIAQEIRMAARETVSKG